MSDVTSMNETGAVVAFVVATAPGADGAARQLLWRDVAGHPPLYWILTALSSLDLLDHCRLIAPHSEQDAVNRVLREVAAPVRTVVTLTNKYSWKGALIEAGEEPDVFEHLIVLDAALPLVTPACLRAGLRAADKSGVAIAGEQVKETLKRVHGQFVIETPPRDTLRRLLTPIVFRRDALLDFCATYTQAASDDLFALIQQSGASMSVFDAGYPALRATSADDLPIIEALLRQRHTEIEKA